MRKARNSDKNGKYNYLFADQQSQKRRKEAGAQRHKIKGDLERKVKEKLLQTWSPEQVSGYLKIEDNVYISAPTIYKYVKSGRVPMSCLRHSGKKYKPSKKIVSVKFIPNRVDISERPKIVEEKSRVGDWEGDLVISHHSHCALLALVDRASKHVIIEKIEDKTMQSTNAAIIKALKNQPIHTITFDNESEFAGHEIVANALKAKIYFVRPYKSCERGFNEHTNGLIRQFLPKKFDFKNVTNHEIKIIEDYLNNRPRKVLEYKKPLEICQSLVV